MLRYNLNKDGYVTEIGYIPSYDIVLTNEPFDMASAFYYRFDFEDMRWISMPDITPVDKTIRNVEYNWQDMTASIYINDIYRPGPYVFNCTSTWAEQDCINAINSLEL